MTDSTGDAWLLQLTGSYRAAIGLREMLYVLPEEPVSHLVPLSRPHAARVMVWQSQLIPLIDLTVFLGGDPAPDARRMIGIVSCAAGNDSKSTSRLGGLMISRTPERIQVWDHQACGLPPAPAQWRSIAASCFRHPDHGPVPILDLAAILLPN